MPIFAIGGLVADAIATISGWFVAGGVVASFFARIGILITTKVLVVPIHLSLMAVMTVARIVFLTAVITFILKVWNMIKKFFVDIPTFFSGNDILSTAFQVLQSIGFIDALSTALSELSLLFVSIFLIIIAKLVLHISEYVSNEFFKLGLLLSV